jgi:hypothetical protein
MEIGDVPGAKRDLFASMTIYEVFILVAFFSFFTFGSEG